MFSERKTQIARWRVISSRSQVPSSVTLLFRNGFFFHLKNEIITGIEEQVVFLIVIEDVPGAISHPVRRSDIQNYPYEFSFFAFPPGTVGKLFCVLKSACRFLCLHLSPSLLSLKCWKIDSVSILFRYVCVQLLVTLRDTYTAWSINGDRWEGRMKVSDWVGNTYTTGVSTPLTHSGLRFLFT